MRVNIAKETKRRSRDVIGVIPVQRVIRNKKLKKPKHKKRLED